jgi:hypothetical protein
MYKLNGKERKQKKTLIKAVEDDVLLRYLTPDILKMRDMLMKEFLEVFTTLGRQMILWEVINYYNSFADRWCDDFENKTKKSVFPYISKASGGAFIRGFYDRIRKIWKIRGYTEAYLQETDPKKQTEDHYLIVEFAVSKMLIELLVLGEKGRYDNESLLLHIVRLCNVIKCTRIENNELKNNQDEEGLRHLEGYLKRGIKIYDKDKREKSCDSDPRIINFTDLPSNRDLFITDMYYPELKYYTNRMFVADHLELKKLGKPKIKK